jgi:hypothetical protein
MRPRIDDDVRVWAKEARLARVIADYAARLGATAVEQQYQEKARRLEESIASRLLEVTE